MSAATPPAIAAAGGVWLDHVGLIVHDLERARAAMAALGFTLTARADHTMTLADGRTVSAGSSQHAVMLAQGYVELMEITDPAAGHQLAPAPQERFGLHILALGAADAEAAHAGFVRSGQAVGPIRRWSRLVDEPDRQGLARFVYFDAPWVAQDPSYLCWVQHLTPELMRATQAPAHANGAVSVQAIHYAGAPALARAWAQRLQGLGLPARTGTKASVLDLGASRLEIRVQEGSQRVLPDVLELGFASLDEIRQRSQAAGFAGTPLADGSWQVDLRADLGVVLRCVAETQPPAA